MRNSAIRRTTSAAVAAGLAATFTIALAVPAGATLPVKNDKFCKIIYGDERAAGIDFEGLSPEEAAYAAKLFRRLANTGVPAKLEKDLKGLAKIDQRIADGASARKVLAAEQDFITPALIRFSRYAGANCAPPVPST